MCCQRLLKFLEVLKRVVEGHHFRVLHRCMKHFESGRDGLNGVDDACARILPRRM